VSGRGKGWRRTHKEEEREAEMEWGGGQGLLAKEGGQYVDFVKGPTSS